MITIENKDNAMTLDQIIALLNQLHPSWTGAEIINN
jgi:hypothetical protein